MLTQMVSIMFWVTRILIVTCDYMRSINTQWFKINTHCNVLVDGKFLVVVLFQLHSFRIFNPSCGVTLVFQYPFQSLLFNENIDKLLGRFLDLFLK